MKFFLNIILLIIWMPALPGQSGAHVVLEDTLRVYPLENHTSVWVDTTGELGWEVIRQPEVQELFQPLYSIRREGDPGWAYWLRIPVTSPDRITDWLLVLTNADAAEDGYLDKYLALNREVDAWYAKKGAVIKRFKTGLYVPASQRTFPEKPALNAFPFSMEPGDSLTLWLRVCNPDEAWVNLFAELHPPGRPLPFHQSFTGMLGFSMGVTGILGLLTFFFFWGTKDKAYLYFSLTSFVIALHYTILHPDMLFVQWFIPGAPWLVEYGWILLTYGSFFFFILFGRAFVDLRKHSMWMDRVMTGLAATVVIGILLDWIALAFQLDLSFPFIPLIALGVILMAIRIGFLPGRLTTIFAAGACWLMAFTILGILYNNDIFPFFNPWPVGQIGLMVIYTLGLAYKLQLNERAKAEAERVLELDAVKSRFFANISHEFRTPLTLILGPLKKARERLPVSEQELWEKNDADVVLPARHIGLMHRNAERLQQLINQLLDLSKLENGSMKLRVAKGDVVSFIRAIVCSFESLAEHKQIHFQTEFPEAGQPAYYDRDKLEKIVVNLLSNAFKYTPEKGNIFVKTALEKGRLKVMVEDSGPGIPKAELDKIFDRFYQVEGTEDKGTGIGLSLVKELVDLHRGQISVDCGRGSGTRFKVSLPADKVFFEENERAEIVASSEGGKMESAGLEALILSPFDNGASGVKHSPAGKENLPLLLVVEDNPDLRRFIAETLAQEYRVMTAENGRKGLQTAIEHVPDLIISDVMMPEMDGFTLCETLKKDEHTSHVPVILLTAKAGQQHKVEGLETGADAYLTKPFDEKELRVRAKNLIEQRRRLGERYAGLNGLQNFVQLNKDEKAITSADERFLQKVVEAIGENMDNEFFSVEDLAGAVAFSRSQLHRKLKALTNKSPNEWIREMRMNRAKELLEKGHGNVSEVAMEVGYSSVSYFTRSFKAAFGVLPSDVYF